MPRRNSAVKKPVLPDPIFGSKKVTKLVNQVMVSGKKGLAQRIVYDAFEIIKEKEQKDPLEVFEAALNNVMPVLEVKARRIGGSTYQVPLEVKADRGMVLGSTWIIDAAKKRSGKSMVEKLTNELMDASNGVGAACKKREDTHKMAEANKAFAHYRY